MEDMVNVRLSLDTGMVDMDLLLSMSHRLTMDMAITLPITHMVITFTRGLLMLSQDMAMVMPPATLTEAPRVCMDIMVVMDMVVMDMVMVMVMARGLLMLDTMVVPALMSTRPVLTTMDLMAMVSTTMARGLLMLDITAMEVMAMELEVTSRSAGHTPTMVSVLPTLTKCQMEIVRQLLISNNETFIELINKKVICFALLTGANHSTGMLK